MKIAYIANARIPTEKAHGIQIMNTCAALARAGAEIELLIPDRSNPIQDDPFSFYDIDKPFLIRKAACVDLLGSPLPKKLSFALQTFSFTASALFMLVGNLRGAVIYGRDEAVLAPLALFSKSVYWESHTGSTNLFARLLLKRAKGVVSISSGLADLYIGKGLDPKRSLVAHDAVDLRRFRDLSDDKKALRKELGLPFDASIVTYSGSIGLYSWKGVDVFLESLKHVSVPGARFLVVGGSQGDVSRLRIAYPDKRISFVGSVKPGDVPSYLKASDVLVLPNRSGNEVSERYTSPMKLFEYMASKTPIVASDLPSIREVLDSENSVLFSPNDPKALAGAVERVLKDPVLARQLSERSFSDVMGHTWDNRARKISDFIESGVN